MNSSHFILSPNASEEGGKEGRSQPDSKPKRASEGVSKGNGIDSRGKGGEGGGGRKFSPREIFLPLPRSQGEPLILHSAALTA